MLCAVYKSLKKQDTYLYITKRDDFSAVPEALLTTFGRPQFVLMFNMSTKSKLSIADIDKVRAALNESGYYLQLPPPKENLLDELKTHLKKQGLSNDE